MIGKENSHCNVETGVCATDSQILHKGEESIVSSKGEKLKLTYFYDALCGWCYGFSPVITELQEIYKDKIEIDVVSGGLFSGVRVGLINDVAGYIKEGAYKSVEERTSVKFGTTFLEKVYGDGAIILDSLNPSIALSIVKNEAPQHKLVFAKTLLEATYRDGLSTDDVEGYASYAKKIGFNKSDFIAKMKDEKYINAANSDYKHFRSSGLRGMPSLVLHREDEAILLLSGYADLESLKTQLNQFL